MKINSIQNPNINNTINVNFKGKDNYIALPLKNNENKTTGMKVKIPINGKDYTTYQFGKEADVFLDKKGEVNKNSLEIFAELFQQFFKQKNKQYDKDKKIAQEALSKTKNKIISLNPIKDMFCALQKSENCETKSYIENMLDNIKDEKTKSELAEEIIKKIEENTQENAMLSAQEAIAIMKLSKKGDDFDLSEMDKKINITVMMCAINKNGNVYTIDDLIDDFSDDKGKLNLKLALEYTELIYDAFFDTNIGFTTNNINPFHT